jgi:hypothetical protein
MTVVKRSILSFALFLVLTIPAKAIISEKDSTLTFFPKTRIFPVIFLDPLECQINGGTYLLLRKGSNESLYNNVNLGFTKPITRYQGEQISWEMNFGAATFTQFDLIQRTDGVYLAGLLNNDYKVSVDLSTKKDNNLLRLKVFHVSSHLGDDYITRHNDIIPNDKSVNYEQLDLTYLRLKENNYWFFGLGEIYTPYAFRKRFSLHTGGLMNFKKTKSTNLFTSVNIKLLEQNNYSPDLRAAFGISINRKTESLVRICMEYYTGQLPYSTLKYGRVNWLGLAVWINLF